MGCCLPPGRLYVGCLQQEVMQRLGSTVWAHGRHAGMGSSCASTGHITRGVTGFDM
jgi:hypothetical protein